MADVENLTCHASGIPWSYKKSYVLDRTMGQKAPSTRSRSNNILHSNSSNETNLTVVIDNATIINKRPTPLTSKQNIADSTPLQQN